MSTENWVEHSLKELRGQHLEREILPASPDIRWDFSSNDYLALSRHPSVVAAARAALNRDGAGASAARLVANGLPEHDAFEAFAARTKGYPAALLFGSGYLANVGAIPALVSRDDHVFADRLVHASLVDGIQLSRAQLHRFQHNDVDHLQRLLERTQGGGRRLVITESVFSMDGDVAPLAELAACARRFDALFMVDEAHATGILGPGGAGLASQLGIQDLINVSMFTLSKGLGSYGGAVACSIRLRKWLLNKARSFIYTTALPTSAVAAARAAWQVVVDDPGIGRRLLDRVARFRARLEADGFQTLGSSTQIVPLLVGESDAALAFSDRLRRRGVLARAIRPPTVPSGTARIRFSVTLAHSDENLAEVAGIIRECRP